MFDVKSIWVFHCSGRLEQRGMCYISESVDCCKKTRLKLLVKQPLLSLRYLLYVKKVSSTLPCPVHFFTDRLRAMQYRVCTWVLEQSDHTRELVTKPSGLSATRLLNTPFQLHHALNTTDRVLARYTECVTHIYVDMTHRRTSRILRL